MMTDAEKTAAIENALIAKFGGDHICALEVAVMTGDYELYSGRIDFWMLKNGMKPIATAFEIKASRADFKRDSQRKQAHALHNSHQFYYITPVGLLDKKEIPAWAGLMECDVATGKIRVVIKSPIKDASPTWQFMAGLIRKSGRVMRDMDTITKERDNLKHQVKRLQAEART